eukprot:m51a1_g8873 putative serine threonine protein kinase (1704) ;mRNA; r:610235-618112
MQTGTQGPLAKLTQLTGRKDSLLEIACLLHARSAGEARTNAEVLYRAERLKRHYGSRPELAGPALPPTAPATPRWRSTEGAMSSEGEVSFDCRNLTGFDRGGGWVIYLGVVLYSFLLFSIICDEYFVPSLNAMCEAFHMSDELAGATLMAAGGEAPELFSSIIGTLVLNSPTGMGTVVGSEIFNMLVIIGATALSTLGGEVLVIDGRLLLRDGTFYGASLVIFLLLVIWRGQIAWWAAVILLLGQVVYVLATVYWWRIMRLLRWDNREKEPRMQPISVQLPMDKYSGPSASDVSEAESKASLCSVIVHSDAAAHATSPAPAPAAPAAAAAPLPVATTSSDSEPNPTGHTVAGVQSDSGNASDRAIISTPGFEYNRVIFHGSLYKMSRFYSKVRISSRKWAKRWFVLQEHQFFYCKNPLKPKQDAHVIDIARGVVEALPGDCEFSIKTPQRQYVLRAPDQATRDQWISKLTSTVLFYESDSGLLFTITIPDVRRPKFSKMFIPAFILSSTQQPVVVVGVSAGDSQIEQSAAEGLVAAIEEAARLTTLPLVPRRLDHVTEADLIRNVERLVANESAFLVATTTGTSDTEPRLLGLLRAAGVPLVGTLSACKDLRDVANLTAAYDSSGSKGELPFVVNVRASGVVELDAVLSVISHDWDVLQRVALVTHDMDFDTWVIDYVNSSIRTLTGASGLASYATIDRENHTDSDIKRGIEKLFEDPRRPPQVLIVATTPNTTAQFVRQLAASRSSTGLKVFFVSWVSPEDLAVRLSPAVKALLARNRVQMFFTQNMPFPNASAATPWQSTPLLRRFRDAGTRAKSHAALEGYLTGWFIYEVAQKAIAHSGLPLTRQAFLSAVFEDVRTFNVLGVTLGPYGDGRGSTGGTAAQSAADACNQGVHEVFLTVWDPVNDTQTPLTGATLKFAGCSAPEWTARGSVTVVGSFDDVSNGVELTTRAGLFGAVNAHNSKGASSMVLRSRLAKDIKGAASDLVDGKVVAVVTPELQSARDAQWLRSFATIAPMPVHPGLVVPFTRGIVNLFASAYDEMMVALKFFESQSKRSIAVIRNDESAYTSECVDGLTEALKHHPNITKRGEFTEDAASFIRDHEGQYDAFLVLGGKLDGNSVPHSATMRLLNSQVEQVHSVFDPNSTARSVTHTLSVFPPESHFASTSPLRTEYATWVSSDGASGSLSFMGFLAGQFLSQVVDVAKQGDVDKVLTSTEIVDAVYKRSSFSIGGVQFGPFNDRGSGSVDSCNQGSNTVYVLQGDLLKKHVFHDKAGNCGWWFEPASPQSSDTDLVLGLVIGLGGCTVLVLTALSVVVWRARRTVEFFNIRKGEIELGTCLGKGRFGAMYMADWHGTTVAVRVIDKEATPKEDQRLIKEEVLLLHKHHHPNLLMLMGYCETRSDILVVTEYMEGGTLADYLAKEKRYSGVYTLVAMAFDVVKGIAYLHSCKPPIVHGSICTHNLLMDGKGTVKVSDFWYSSKKGAFSSSGSSRTLKRAAWQPPEVIAGMLLTPATDVYAFGIVLWELIAPVEMTQSAASCTASESQTSSVHTPCPAPASPRLGTSMSLGNGPVELSVQLGPPEIPPNASPEVADLMEKCWDTRPERRPSIFQILRSWLSTFSSLGDFEIPQDLIQSVGSANAAGLMSQHSGHSSCKNAARAEDSSDDVSASMASFMAVKVDSVAMQVPQQPEKELSQLAASPPSRE